MITTWSPFVDHQKLVTQGIANVLLMLMYKLSIDIGNVDARRPEMVLRTRPKVKIKVPFTEKERVWRSPFYVGSRLWDKLESSV